MFHYPASPKATAILDRQTQRQVMEFASNGEDLLRQLTFSGFGSYEMNTVTEAGLQYIGAYNPSSVSNRVKQKMRLDPQIRLGLSASKAPTFTAPWMAECESRELKAIVEYTILERWMRTILHHGLRAVDFGYQVDEPLWMFGVETFSWHDDDGIEHTTDYTGYGLRALRDLHPDSLKFVLTAKTGNTVGIVQEQPSGLMDVVKDMIPIERLFHFTHGQEWGNPYGDGRLTWVYDPWYWCTVMYLFCNQYFERRAVPTAKVFMPPNTTVKDPETNVSARNPVQALAMQIQTQLKNMSVLAFESIFDPGSQGRLWDIEYLETDPRGEMFLRYIEHLQTMKLRGLLHPERISTQDAEVGSQAMAKTHKGTGNLMATSMLDDVELMMNAQVIPQWAKANSITERIRVRHCGIAEESETLFRDLLSKIVVAEQAVIEGKDLGVINGTVVGMIDAAKMLERLGIPMRDSAAYGLTDKMKATPTVAPEDQKVAASRERIDLAVITESPSAPAAATLEYDELMEMFDEWGDEVETRIAELTEPQVETLSTREKAAAAIMALLLLRSKKEDASGNVVPGDDSLKGLVYNKAMQLKPLPTIASNLPKLQAALKAQKDSGLRVTTAGNKALVAKFQRDMGSILGAKPLVAAVDQASGIKKGVAGMMNLGKDHFTHGASGGAWGIGANLRAILKGGYPGRVRGTTVDGEPVFRKRSAGILDVNVEGIAHNIENIALRAVRGAVELIRNAFGARRNLERVEGDRHLMALTDDVIAWHLHPTYTDLTLQAHLRAAYRAAMLQIAQANGMSYFVGRHPEEREEEDRSACRALDGKVATEAWWNARGEESGNASPMEMFGMGWGCRMLFFPVPEATLLKGGSPAVET